MFHRIVSNYLSLRGIRISIISIIVGDFIDLESFDQSLAAILKNGCQGHQGANLRWPKIHFCSQDINQHICQIWCLYHKMNNWFDMLSYAAPLYGLSRGLTRRRTTTHDHARPRTTTHDHARPRTTTHDHVIYGVDR